MKMLVHVLCCFVLSTYLIGHALSQSSPSSPTLSQCENALIENHLLYTSNKFQPIDLTKQPCALLQAFWQVRQNFTRDDLVYDNTKLLDTYCSLTENTSCTTDVANTVIKTIKTDCAVELETYNTYTPSPDNRSLYNSGGAAVNEIFNYYLSKEFRDAICSKSDGEYCFANMRSDYSAHGVPDITTDNEKECENCAQKEITKIYRHVQKISDQIVSKKVNSFLKNPKFKLYADACSPEIRFGSLFFAFIRFIYPL